MNHSFLLISSFWWAMWVNCSFSSNQMSDVSESLRTLTKNEWPWAICSGRSKDAIMNGQYSFFLIFPIFFPFKWDSYNLVNADSVNPRRVLRWWLQVCSCRPTMHPPNPPILRCLGPTGEPYSWSSWVGGRRASRAGHCADCIAGMYTCIAAPRPDDDLGHRLLRQLAAGGVSVLGYSDM